MKKLIQGIQILQNEKIINNGYMIIEDDIISEIGEGFCNEEDLSTIDLKNKKVLALPGLINSHTHSGMAALKGAGDDLPFEEWLFNRIVPLEDRLDEELIYLSTMISQMEMARNGITTFVDMYMSLDSITRAVSDFGMRAYICRGLQDQAMDDGQRLKKNIDAYEKHHGSSNGRISIGFGPHSPYLCSKNYLRKVSDVTSQLNALMHIHLKESQRESDQYTFRELAEIGLFNTKTIAAHCVYASPEDINVLQEFNVSVAHNPISNLKLANGIAPVDKMIEAGINVCLGTDSVSSNNSLDLFREMLVASLIHKGKTKDPQVIPALTSFKMATVNGAKAFGHKNLGIIEKGKKADIIFIDTENINLIPFKNPISNIVYSGRGSDVVATMVDGQLIYHFGTYPTIDEQEIKKQFMDKFVRLYE
ncbi:MAG TPA: amidohydrolase [Thermotogota bacterium]|nr:amidohydrolase [Thermotogota bacterium]